MSDEEYMSGESDEESVPLSELQNKYAEIFLNNIKNLGQHDLENITLRFIETNDVIALWNHVVISQMESKKKFIDNYLFVFYERFDSIMLDYECIKMMHHIVVKNILDNNYLKPKKLERFLAKWIRLTNPNQQIKSLLVIKESRRFDVTNLIPIIILISALSLYYVVTKK